MNKREVTVGLVGAGNIGKIQAAAFKRNPAIVFKGITDVNSQAAEALAETIGTKSYPSVSALADAGIDALLVCTPPLGRADIFDEAFSRGIAVFAEKPLALDLKMAEYIEARQKEYGRPAAVGFCHRFVPFVRQVQEIKRAGTFGRLLHLSQRFIVGSGQRLKASWMSDPAISGGGVVMDTMCHSIDLAQFLAGNFATADLKCRFSWAGRGETAAIVNAQSEEGTLVELTGSWEYPVPHYDLAVIFEQTELTYNYSQPFYMLQQEGQEPSQVPVEHPRARFDLQVEAFLKTLEGEDTSICQISEAVSVARVIEQLYQGQKRL